MALSVGEEDGGGSQTRLEVISTTASRKLRQRLLKSQVNLILASTFKERPSAYIIPSQRPYAKTFSIQTFFDHAIRDDKKGLYSAGPTWASSRNIFFPKAHLHFSGIRRDVQLSMSQVHLYMAPATSSKDCLELFLK
jgi:hypothetical protein